MNRDQAAHKLVLPAISNLLLARKKGKVIVHKQGIISELNLLLPLMKPVLASFIISINQALSAFKPLILKRPLPQYLLLHSFLLKPPLALFFSAISAFALHELPVQLGCLPHILTRVTSPGCIFVLANLIVLVIFLTSSRSPSTHTAQCRDRCTCCPEPVESYGEPSNYSITRNITNSREGGLINLPSLSTPNETLKSKSPSISSLRAQPTIVSAAPAPAPPTGSHDKKSHELLQIVAANGNPNPSGINYVAEDGAPPHGLPDEDVNKRFDDFIESFLARIRAERLLCN